MIDNKRIWVIPENDAERKTALKIYTELEKEEIHSFKLYRRDLSKYLKFDYLIIGKIPRKNNFEYKLSVKHILPNNLEIYHYAIIEIHKVNSKKVKEMLSNMPKCKFIEIIFTNNINQPVVFACDGKIGIISTIIGDD